MRLRSYQSFWRLSTLHRERENSIFSQIPSIWLNIQISIKVCCQFTCVFFLKKICLIIVDYKHPICWILFSDWIWNLILRNCYFSFNCLSCKNTVLKTNKHYFVKKKYKLTLWIYLNFDEVLFLFLALYFVAVVFVVMFSF